MISKEEQKKLNDELLEASNFEAFNLEKVKELIKKGAEVDARDTDGKTPLHMAALNGNLEVVKYLIEEANADVDARDKWEQTPLEWAPYNGNLEIVKYLFLEQNALMSIFGMFQYQLMKKKVGRRTEAQSIFDYFLQNINSYKPYEIQEFKTAFLQLQMNKEDSMNLKPLVKEMNL